MYNHFYIADVTEWSRALNIRFSDWRCNVSMAWVQIPARENTNLTYQSQIITRLGTCLNLTLPDSMSLLYDLTKNTAHIIFGVDIIRRYWTIWIVHFWDLHIQIYLPVIIINCYINNCFNKTFVVSPWIYFKTFV